MRTEKENTGIGVENILRPVAVVNVPVGNDNAFHSVFLLRIAGGHRDVIEQTKPHAAIGRGVMAGRANHAEGVGRFALHHKVDGVQAYARRSQGHVVGADADFGIAGAESLQSHLHVALRHLNVVARVAQSEFVHGRCACGSSG